MKASTAADDVEQLHLIDPAKIAAALALIALSLGCSYNYGYFHDIGFNYFRLLTYKDHLSATVYFVPPTLVLSLPWLARRKWEFCDFIGCAILGLTILFWTALDPGPDILGAGVARVFYNIKAVLTAL